MCTLSEVVGALHHFAISTISSAQTVGTPFTINTITARDANSNTVSSFGSTVTFGGSAGVAGTSAAFTSGVLNNAKVTPTVAGDNLTVTVTGGGGYLGSAMIARINAGTPLISTVPSATAITYPQSLSASTLTGGAATNEAGTSVPGSFAFTTPATVPNVGTANQSVTFTPADTANYNNAMCTASVTVNRAVAQVTLGNLSQVYNGTARTCTVTTVPGNLNVVVTYNGSASLPQAVGSYAVTGTVSDANYQGSTNGTLVVSKADQGIAFTNPGDQFTTNVVALSATATSGLAVTFAVVSGPAQVSGSTLTFTNAGMVQVVAMQPGDGNWNAATPVTNTFNVTKVVAGITLSGLNQTYNGLVRTVTALTTPGGLAVDITYDGSTSAPKAAASYAVTATVSSANAMYQGQVFGTLTVDKAALTITANNKSKTYGAALPTLTVSYSGLVNGDSAPVTPPSIGTTALGSSPVGTYPITASGAADPNYAISYVAGTLTVDKALLTITAENTSKAYGAALPTFTCTYSGFVNGDSAPAMPPSLGTTALASSPVGTYAITGSGAADPNYTMSYVAGTLTVSPVALTITAEDKSKAYGAVLPPFTVSYSGLVNGDTAPATPPSVGTTALASSSVGTYPITASGAVDANYTIGYAAGTLTVNPVALTITADNKSKTYGAAVPTLTVSYSGLVNGDSAPATPPSIGTTALASSPVGTYPITASAAVDPNYTISYVGGTLTVDRKALTITADNKTKTYGAALPALTVSYTGLVNGDTAPSKTPDIGTTALVSSPVGAYPISASGASDPNYTINYVAGTLTVAKAALTITAEDKSKAYGEALPTFTCTYSGFVNGDSAPATPPSIDTTALMSSPVGTYPITASGASDPNYSIGYVAGSLAVNPVALTITADNKAKPYGAALPTLTVSYSGLVNGDSAPATPPGIGTTALASSPVGTYPISASAAVDPNYTISYVGGTLTVDKAALTITANSKSKTYGAALPTLTVSYSGLVNGDSAPTIPPSIGTTALGSSPVGTYPITASGAADPNYAISYVAGTLTVDKAVLTITAENKSKAYGAALPTFTCTYSGFVNGDSAPGTPPSLGTTALVSSPVGTYAITGSGAADPNYTMSYVAGTLTVSPVALMITADNKSKAYGAAVPPLTVSYSGLVNGDTAPATPPSVGTTALASSPVGTYPITASGAVDANYTIGYAAGTLTVDPVALTITADNKSKTYGAAVPTLTVSYSGLVNGDSAPATPPSIGTTALASSPVGTYPITASAAVDPNYTISYVGGTLTVDRKALTITADNKTKTYGAALPSLTVSYTGLVNGDTAPSKTPDIGTTALVSSPVGTYPISASGASDPNYTINYVAGTLTVSKATAEVTLENLNQVYDGTARICAANTVPGSLNVVVTYNGSTSAPQAAGSYAVTGTVNEANYQGSTNGTLVVTKAEAAVTLGSLNQTYDGAAKHATATTTPSGLLVNFTYNGSVVVPTNAGSYAVTGTVSDVNYQGSAAGNLVVGKAGATVTLGGLSQTYNGAAKSVTASTTPGGLAVAVTYDGSVTAPTNVGSYAVTGTVTDVNYQGVGTGILAINKAAASVALGNLSQTYDGTAKTATASTTPGGLTVNLTYNGSATAPVTAGSYAVTGTVSDVNYQGSGVGTMVISKAAATVSLGNLSQTYDGTARTATATTSPGGLTVNLTYNGSATSPTNAGSYAVTGTVSEVNYQGSAAGTLVVGKAVAAVTVSNLSQTYDGTAKNVTATTTPNGLAVVFTYNGSATAPTNAGNYAVTGTVSDVNYLGTTNGTLAVAKAVVTVNSGISANNKVYDRTTTAILSTNNVILSGVVAADVANVKLSTNGYTATFANSDVGTGVGVTVSGLTLIGSAIGNYTLTQPTLSANITPVNVTINSGVTANNKVYDGTTTATLSTNNVSLAGVIPADAANVKLATNGYAATFASSAVGTRSVTVSGLTLTGSAAGNYSLTQPPGLTASISARPVQVSGTRVYDGTREAGAGSLTIVNNVDGANLTLSGSVTLADKNVGTQSASVRTVARIQSATGNTTGNSTSFGVTLGSAPNSGNTLVAVISTRGASQDQVSSITQTGAAWSRVSQSANANGTTTEIWYAPNAMGAGTAVTIALVSSLRAAAVVMEYSGVLSVGASDQIAATTGSGTTANTGTTPTTSQANELWIGGIGLQGNSVTMSGLLSTFVEINNATSTGSPGGNNSRVYAIEKIVTSTGMASSGGSLSGPSESSGAMATFRTTPTVISGTAAGNYSLGDLNGSVTITSAVVAVSSGLSANSKVYDGTTTGTLSTGTVVFAGVVAADTANVKLSTNGYSATFASAGAANGISVTVNGLWLTGAASGNYTLTQPSLSANITPAPVTIASGLTANDKVYDGTVAASISSNSVVLSGVLGGDSGHVVLSTNGYTATFANAGAGTGKAVTVGGLTLTGSAAGNYVLTQPTLAANITPATVTISSGVTANNKVYNGTVAATLSTNAVVLAGVLAGDAANVKLSTNTYTATFVSSGVGTDIGVTVSGLTLTGSAAGNYALTQPGLVANITPAPVTITSGVVANNKSYDGTTTATLSTGTVVLAGVVSADAANVKLSTNGYTATFASAGVANGIGVTVGGLSLTGTAAGNYSLIQPGLSANITKATVTIASGVTANNKIYNGTVAATLSTGTVVFAGVMAADTANVSLSTNGYTATFASTGVANGIGVTVSGLALTGAAAGNYALTQPALAANITPATVTIASGVTANNKVYNGTVSATLSTGTVVFAGVVAADAANVKLSTNGYSATFAAAGVANGVGVTVNGLTLVGTAAGNYTLTQPNLNANITPAPVTISSGVTANSKTYDGTTTATLSTSSVVLAGLVAGDEANVIVSTNGYVATFASRAVGSRVVTVSGFTLTGSAAGNYALTQPTLSASITQLPITVTAVTDSKTADGTTSSAGVPTIVPSLVSGDTASFTQRFDTATAGTGKTLTPSGSVNDGNSGNNYSVSFVSVNTGTIIPAAASKLVFTTAAQILTAGVVSGPLTVQRQDAFNNPVTVGLTTVNLGSDSMGTKSFRDDVGTTTITSVNIASGTSVANFRYLDARAGAPTLTVSATGLTSGTQVETVSPGRFAKLQILTPGEVANPGTDSGKTGLPSQQIVTIPFNVSVNAVDSNWNKVNTVSDTVRILSSDLGANLPLNAALMAGSNTFSVVFGTVGSQTVTASNVSDVAKSSDTTPPITVNPLPTLAIGDATVTEGNSGSLNASFTVRLSVASPFNVQFTYATSNGTATAGSDYTTSSGTITILANQTNATVNVPVIGETLYEGSTPETFFVNLTSPVNASFADAQGVGTIIDNDPIPAISVNDVTAAEGNSGTANMNFTVSLANGSAFPVQVGYSTADGTALAGSDYDAASGTLMFAPGQTSTSVTIRAIGDTLFESNETYTIQFANAINATITDGIGVGTINNDDAIPALSIQGTSVLEGGSGTTTGAVFLVTLSALSALPAVAEYTTVNGTAQGGTDFGDDFGLVTIPAGQLSTSIVISVYGDDLYEGESQDFSVQLANPLNATNANAVGVCTIFNDDHPSSFEIDDNFENGFGAWKNVTGDNADWIWQTGPTPTASTGPESGNTGGDSAGYYIFMETARGGADRLNDTEFLLSPNLDASGYAILLSFYYHMYGNQMGTLAVDVYDGSWHMNVWSVSGQQQTSGTAAYAFTNVDLSAYRGIITVRMRGVSAGGDRGNIALDDITLTGAARNQRPAIQLGIKPFDNEEMPTSQPSFEFVATDPDGAGRITYQVQWSTDPAFTSNVLMRTSGVDAGFENIINAGDLPPFTGGQTVRFKIQPADALAASALNEAYYWRVRAMDNAAQGGSGYFGDWSKSRSLRVNLGLPDSRWAQVSDGQFELDSLANVSPCGDQGLGLGGVSMIESYKPNDDQEGNATTWYAQVFSHSTDFTVTKIRVKMKRKTTGSHSFYLRATTGGATALPLSGTSNNLATATRVYVASESLQSAWYEYVFNTNVTIPANTKFAIVQEKTDVAVWRRLKRNSTYPNGTYCSSASDATWAADSKIDCAFEVWGSTPALSGTAVSTPIDATWRPGRTWKGLFVADDETYGDIRYDVQYWTGSAWQDTSVTNQDDFPVDLSSLNTTTHSLIRLVGRFTGTGTHSPYLRGWGVSWDDPTVVLISDPSAMEGNSGTTNITFNVYLPAPALVDVSLKYATSNGTAIAGRDYVATNGTLTIPAGRMSTSIVVRVKGDKIPEGTAETFFVNLSDPQNAALAKAVGVGTITDDDPVESEPPGKAGILGTYTFGHDVVVEVQVGSNDWCSVLAADGSPTGNWQTIYTTDSAQRFLSFTDPGVASTPGRRFYKILAGLGGAVTTNPVTYAIYATATETGKWYKLSMPIDFGTSARMDSTLGEQLTSGLKGGTSLTGDRCYVMDTNGDWHICYLSNNGIWRTTVGDLPVAVDVHPWQSFWIKRLSAGTNTVAVYTGPVHTDPGTATFRSNQWHMIAWPFSTPKREDQGAEKSWGFAAAGAKRGVSALYSDQLYAGEGSMAGVYFLNLDGRWCRSGSTVPATNLVFQAGQAYYYFHRGTGFVWTAKEN